MTVPADTPLTRDEALALLDGIGTLHIATFEGEARIDESFPAEFRRLRAYLAALPGATAGEAVAQYEPRGGFRFSDLWDAYERGARDAREHPECDDALISRCADAYCKTKAVAEPER